MNTYKSLQFLVDFEEMSLKESLLSKIDTLFKLILILFFAIINVSLDKYDLNKSILLLSYTTYIFAVSSLTFKHLIKIILYTSFFIIFIVIFNPIFDRDDYKLGNYIINAGIISAVTIYIKLINIVILTSSLLASTRPSSLISSLKFIKLPPELILSLLITYRFIFIFLLDIIETSESISSRRKYNSKITLFDMKHIFSAMFQKAIYRSESIYETILSKGNIISNIQYEIKIKPHDILFLLISFSYLLTIRFIL